MTQTLSVGYLCAGDIVRFIDNKFAGRNWFVVLTGAKLVQLTGVNRGSMFDISDFEADYSSRAEVLENASGALDFAVSQQS